MAGELERAAHLVETARVLDASRSDLWDQRDAGIRRAIENAAPDKTQQPKSLDDGCPAPEAGLALTIRACSMAVLEQAGNARRRWASEPQERAGPVYLLHLDPKIGNPPASTGQRSTTAARRAWNTDSLSMRPGTAPS